MSFIPPPTAPAKIPMKMPAVIASKVAVLFSGTTHLPSAPVPINVKMSMKSPDTALLSSPSVSPSPQPRIPTAQSSESSSSPAAAVTCKLEKPNKDVHINAPNQIIRPEKNYSNKNEAIDNDENVLLGITNAPHTNISEMSVKVENINNDLESTDNRQKTQSETSNASFSSSSSLSSSSSEMSLSRSSSSVSSAASYSSSSSSQSSYSSSSASSSFSNEDDSSATKKKKESRQKTLKKENDKSSAMSRSASTTQTQRDKKTRKVRISRKNGNSDSNTLNSISPEVNEGKRRRQVRTKGKRKSKSKSKRRMRRRNDDGSDEENNGEASVDDSESSADEVDEFGNRVIDKENAQNAMWFAMTDVSSPEDLIALATREGLIGSKDEQSANNEKEDTKNDADVATMVVTVNPPRPPIIRSFPSDIDAAIAKYKERLNREENAVKMKDDTKAVSLGTSKINYIDPRIVCSWASTQNVPINKIFSATLVNKFPWALNSRNFNF